MKCLLHNLEMDYRGENAYGDDLWECMACRDEEEYRESEDSWLDGRPDLYIGLTSDDDDLEELPF